MEPCQTVTTKIIEFIETLELQLVKPHCIINDNKNIKIKMQTKNLTLQIVNYMQFSRHCGTFFFLHFIKPDISGVVKGRQIAQTKHCISNLSILQVYFGYGLEVIKILAALLFRFRLSFVQHFCLIEKKTKSLSRLPFFLSNFFFFFFISTVTHYWVIWLSGKTLYFLVQCIP